MLKCVVYVATAYGYEGLMRQRTGMEKVLAADGIDLILMQKEERLEVPFLADTLFLTDDAETYKWLNGKKYPASVFYHEGNKDVYFEGAPYALENVAELSGRAYEEAYRRLVGLPWDIMETERLKVRESTVADVPEFYRIYGQEGITRYMDDLLTDADEEKAYMEDYIRQFYGFYGFGMWTVIYKETGQVIGRAGLSLREGYELPELGFVIAPSYQGKGLAYEVCRGILKYAREELLFDQVQAFAEAENEASVNLLKKLGFAFVNREKLKDKEYLLFQKKIEDDI
ncbi:MAG: GNAT family N-acetyltransferase [Lachnospiraceae bacterium]|nr:GNAT family N-acetyltransferase [Lachnospiraceae bacterium]